LAVFALSTFTPTQRFGVLMVTLLVAALAGDLILLPALLAGPLGRFFMIKIDKPSPEKKTETHVARASIDSPAQGSVESVTHEVGGETRHSAVRRNSGSIVRSDQEHSWPRH
jgi:hypothetical protein